MNCPYSGTCPNCKECLGDHRHIYDNSITFLNFMIFQDDGHPTYIFINFLESPNLFLIDHIWNPNKSLLACKFREITINHIVNDIDFSIWIPPIKWWVWGVKYSFWELEPLNFLGFLLPKSLSGFRVGSPFKSNIILIWLIFFFLHLKIRK